MLKEIGNRDYERLLKWLNKDPARNYFILLSLKKDPSTFESIWMDENESGILVGIFKRKSGNLQLALAPGFDHEVLKAWIKNHDFKTLICPRSYCQAFEYLLKIKKEGAEIACLKKSDYHPQKVEASFYPLRVEDLQGVEDLYKQVFSGYPKVAYMKEKLLSKRGLGIYLEDMKAVGQSDFDNLIVGVATKPDLQARGYGYQVMHALIQELFKEQDRLYLQYDDPVAKKLYCKLGFKKIDQVFHYEKR